MKKGQVTNPGGEIVCSWRQNKFCSTLNFVYKNQFLKVRNIFLEASPELLVKICMGERVLFGSNIIKTARGQPLILYYYYVPLSILLLHILICSSFSILAYI